MFSDHRVSECEPRHPPAAIWSGAFDGWLDGTRRLCTERQLSTAEAQLALAALNALPGTGAQGAAHAFASICEHHGLDQEVRVLERWIDARTS